MIVYNIHYNNDNICMYIYIYNRLPVAVLMPTPPSPPHSGTPSVRGRPRRSGLSAEAPPPRLHMPMGNRMGPMISIGPGMGLINYTDGMIR